MYCQECGRRNEQNAVFCEFCGSKIEIPSEEDNNIQEQENYVNSQDRINDSGEQHIREFDARPKAADNNYGDKGSVKQGHAKEGSLKKKRKRKPGFIRKYGFLTAQAVICVILITTFILIGQNSTSPEKVAEQYFKDIANGNWEEVYSYYQLSESEFISEELFLKSNANTEMIDYESYQVGAGVRGAEGGGENVVISYYEVGNPNAIQYTIHLEKSGRNKFLFFPEWTVSDSELDKLTAANVGFEVPVGNSVMVDGVVLGEEYAGDSNGETINYIIPLMFSGEHLLQMSAVYMEDYNEIIFVPNADEYQYYGEALSVKQEVLELVFNEACTNLKNIYTAGMNREDFIKVQYLFSENEEIQTAMNTAYSAFAVSLCDEEGYGLKNVDFKNMKGSTTQGYYDNQVVITVQLTMDYSYTAQIKDTVVENETEKEIAKTIESEGSQYMIEFSFISEKDNWLLKNCSFNAIEY